MSTTVVIKHKVGNIDTWLAGHQDRVNVFAPAVSSFKTFRDTDDPSGIAMVLEVKDVHQLKDIIDDPANADLKNRHTVLEPISISMPVTL